MTPGARMPRVYLDEDVDVLLARLLSARGFDCLTTGQAGHLRWRDEAQLEFAEQEGRVILTHNRIEFENLAIAWWKQQRGHAGMVLAIRRSNTYDLARHVLPVLRLYDQADFRNKVLYA